MTKSHLKYYGAAVMRKSENNELDRDQVLAIVQPDHRKLEAHQRVEDHSHDLPPSSCSPVRIRYTVEDTTSSAREPADRHFCVVLADASQPQTPRN